MIRDPDNRTTSRPSCAATIASSIPSSNHHPCEQCCKRSSSGQDHVCPPKSCCPCPLMLSSRWSAQTPWTTSSRHAHTPQHSPRRRICAARRMPILLLLTREHRLLEGASSVLSSRAALCGALPIAQPSHLLTCTSGKKASSLCLHMRTPEGARSSNLQLSFAPHPALQPAKLLYEWSPFTRPSWMTNRPCNHTDCLQLQLAWGRFTCQEAA